MALEYKVCVREDLDDDISTHLKLDKNNVPVQSGRRRELETNFVFMVVE